MREVYKSIFSDDFDEAFSVEKKLTGFFLSFRCCMKI